MTADLTVTRDGELMVAHVEAETDDAVGFVDAYLPPDLPDLVVVDVGRIIVPTDHLDTFQKAARLSGLTCEVVEA